MRSERGQATVEWIGLLLLVALSLAALTRLAPAADGRELGAELAHSVTGTPARAPSPTRTLHPSPPVPRVGGAAVLRLPRLPSSLRQARRGAGAVWKRAWFACLVYERTRYAMAHPESRFPGYTLPFGDALRMVNNCINPVDVFPDLGLPDPGR
jgi:hypothetical protein